MKAYLKLLSAAVLATAASSCSSVLDINDNPNNLVNVTANNILAQALTVTAANYTGNNPSYNTYGSWVVGYWGKSGVVSGFGEELTYNYSTSYYNTLFNNTYDNLEDYQTIMSQGASYPNHAAISRIMKAYNFLLLVDEWGDVPYFQALQGAANTAPAYDKAADIYKDLLVQLDGAIADINTAKANNGRTVGNEDIVFLGDMNKWKQFANSLKLRILLRESQTADATLNSSVASQLTALQSAPDGFITTDVTAQPTYAQNTGQQNPFYNRYAYTAAGTSATERQYIIPTQYILNQYLNNNDPRLTQFYVIGSRGPAVTPTQPVPPTPEWIGAKPGESSSPSFSAPLVASRFLGTATSTPGTTGGFFKGLTAPTILMMLSEHLFNKAEAETRGLMTGNAAADYQNGLVAAFQTAYRGTTAGVAVPADPTTSTATGLTQYRTYIAANATNPLVNFGSATTNGALGKQEIIIYQKYLALNTLASIEAWDDYRRTGLPRLGLNGLPVSSTSTSPRADKLPTRLLYPLTEYSTNVASVNATGSPNQFTKIFWDVVD